MRKERERGRDSINYQQCRGWDTWLVSVARSNLRSEVSIFSMPLTPSLGMGVEGDVRHRCICIHMRTNDSDKRLCIRTCEHVFIQMHEYGNKLCIALYAYTDPYVNIYIMCP